MKIDRFMIVFPGVWPWEFDLFRVAPPWRAAGLCPWHHLIPWDRPPWRFEWHPGIIEWVGSSENTSGNHVFFTFVYYQNALEILGVREACLKKPDRLPWRSWIKLLEGLTHGLPMMLEDHGGPEGALALLEDVKYIETIKPRQPQWIGWIF